MFERAASCTSLSTSFHAVGFYEFGSVCFYFSGVERIGIEVANRAFLGNCTFEIPARQEEGAFTVDLWISIVQQNPGAPESYACPVHLNRQFTPWRKRMRITAIAPFLP